MSLYSGILLGMLLGLTQGLPQAVDPNTPLNPSNLTTENTAVSAITPVTDQGGSGGGGGGSGAANQLSPAYNFFYQFPMPIPPFHIPLTTFTKPDGSGDIQYFEVRIENFTQQVYPDLPPTNLVGYNGVSPGPTFNFTKGTEGLVKFINVREDAFAKATSVHLHGSLTHPPWDGWAEDITPVGFYKNYYYPNEQRARTLWYHDHAVDHTAENAYMGLAGQYWLHDDEEAASGLPTGQFEVPLVLNSKQYSADGQLVLPTEGVSMFGDVIHVNGQPWPFFEVEPRKYRFRVLDVSISRTFRIYLVDDLSITEDDTANHIPFFVVGSDSGRTSAPVSTPDLYSAIAERWEIVIDFEPFAGTSLFLKNFFTVEADTPFTNTNQVMRFDVGTVVTDNTNNGPLPASFAPLPDVPPTFDLNNPDHIFTFERTQDEWKINGATFNDINNRILAKPPRGAIELWKLVNMGGGWSHPIHVHLVDFSVVARQKGQRGVEPYEAVSQQDVVLLGEDEEVYVLAYYAPWDGLYMFHCHNLVHEDDAMMGSFNVSALQDFGYTGNVAEFVDPLDPRFVSFAYDPAVNNLARAEAVELPEFANLHAYVNTDETFSALIEYHLTHASVTDQAPIATQFNPNNKHKRNGIPVVKALETPAPKI